MTSLTIKDSKGRYDALFTEIRSGDRKKGNGKDRKKNGGRTHIRLRKSFIIPKK